MFFYHLLIQKLRDKCYIINSVEIEVLIIVFFDTKVVVFVDCANDQLRYADAQAVL